MRLLRALRREALDRPPVWLMRQAGRYLPEYRELRGRYTFEEAIRLPHVAAEITLQPLRRFPLDGAIVFSDIMTPLMAMGVRVEFDPGPRLQTLTVEEVARLGDLETAKVDFVAETVAAVRASLDDDVAVIGFAGGPVTLLAYLLDGGGSRHFANLRRALHHGTAGEALSALARAMNRYLDVQIRAGADVVQLFDTWSGLLSKEQFEQWAVPSARQALAELGAPTIYFAPGASHLLDAFRDVDATAYGVDWRLPLEVAWRRLGLAHPIQGNLDPALPLCDRAAVRAGTLEVLRQAAGRPGHIFNLGHGVLPETPVESVQAMVDVVVHSDDLVDTSGSARPQGAP